ncbi:hypothetical protein CR343_22830 [Salmonella enterica]|nr:hypothetical protein [Salmonella enterica]
MAKKRKYKCKKCKQIEQKLNDINQYEENRAVIFGFFVILFGLLLVTNKIYDIYNDNNNNLQENQIMIKENEKKVMDLLDMKIQVCKKEGELQPGIYSFHLDSDTSCDTYKREYRKLEEKYKTTKGNDYEINKNTK